MVDISRNERKFMLDMLLYTRQTRMFAQELGFIRERFDSSLLHQYAIIRCIEVIGEASSQISPDTRNAMPQIPWEDMIGMRNRLIHDYSDTRLDIVWTTVIVDLPPLIDALEPLISSEST